MTNSIIDRQKTHGNWTEFAVKSQALKGIVKSKSLEPPVNEGLDMICHKLARIITGDPHHIDHWEDIAGYAMRVAEYIKETDNENTNV